MKRTALIAVVMALALPQWSNAAGWNQSVTAAQKKAKQGNKLIFVDLFADWCGWCHKMEQEVFPSAAFQSQTDNMVLLRLNTEDNGDGTTLARKYAVTSLPTFLVLTPDLGLAGVIHGFLPAPDFVSALKDVEQKYSRFEKDVTEEASYPNDYARRLELAEGYLHREDAAAAEPRLRKLTGERKAPADTRDQAYFDLALAQMFLNRMDDATKTLNAWAQVQSKGETFERGRLLQAQIWMQQGKPSVALDELKSFKKKYPDSRLIGNVEIMIPQIESGLKK